MTSVARRREQDDSGEYSDASQDVEHSNSGNDGGQPESDYDSQGSESDHSERDPENQETERRVDDDEDRSNPQYIPKRGTFYEHDDRTAASGEESTNTTSETTSEKKEGSETPAERRRAPRKSDVINKWSHDKYNEIEQVPKSRDELVAIYGYDIRNEDAPPHARRNRRYGRGPNKYTRTWEDEEAYRRQNAAQVQPRKPPNPEDFPELEAANKYSRKPRPRPRSQSQPASNESSEAGDQQLRRNASIKTARPRTERPKPNITRVVNNNNNSKPAAKPAPKEQREKLPPIENLTITQTVFNNSQGPPQRKVTAVAQQRPVPTEQKKPAPKPQPQPQNNAAPKSPPQSAQQKPQAQLNNQQPASGPESRGGSKRYSSLRQRPLAETYSPQQSQQQQPATTQQQQQPPSQPQPQSQQQQPIRYNEYPAGSQAASQHQGSPVPQIHPQQLIHQQVHRTVSQPHGPSPPHQHPPHTQHNQHSQQQVRLGILEQQQLVSHQHHQMHNLPQPHNIAQLQPAQGYAPPAMMPAQYMQPPAAAANSGVLCGALFPPPAAAYPHQVYPHPHNYATQAGGVTYYSCAEQEQLPRAQRRPTAAIPIVRPHNERPVNSSEKDNIDRIVENMFVRKPWPATHGADSKEKPQTTETRSSQEPQSKESSQPNSLTSSSISTDSKPSENKEEKVEETKEVEQKEAATEESISTDA